MKQTRLCALMLALALLLPGCGGSGGQQRAEQFRAKAELLAAEALTDLNRWEVGDDPLGQDGYGVFFSVCGTADRAKVWSATGDTLDAAWDAAVSTTEAALQKSGPDPVWVKVDLVYLSEDVSMEALNAALADSRPGYFRYGVRLGDGTDLLEAELNGVGLYDYENGVIDRDALNRYLKGSGRKTLSALPDRCTAFKTFGWLCDEDSTVYALESSRLNYGRRVLDPDRAATEALLADAADYLVRQLQKDGSFVYGLSPCSGETLESYNILRHAGSLWALACQYKAAPTEELGDAVRSAADYLCSQIVTNGENSYVLEEKSGELKLGGCALAVIALTECADLLPELDRNEICCGLGNGILSMMDEETGAFYHVLNSDFTPSDEFRTVYYDGEATFALCRLYGLTGEDKWLEAACTSADHFIAEDYTQYGDHWVSYSMNELTKYVTDLPEYYSFALYNAQRNLQDILDSDPATPTDLELLMETFILYNRMMDSGFSVEGFDIVALLRAIDSRVQAQLNACFFPETAMYMAHPQTVLGSFMVRGDEFRVRIDDVQHSMGGLSLYAQYYDKLVNYGMLLYRE